MRKAVFIVVFLTTVVFGVIADITRFGLNDFEPVHFRVEGTSLYCVASSPNLYRFDNFLGMDIGESETTGRAGGLNL
jgi:hypothetical protein